MLVTRNSNLVYIGKAVCNITNCVNDTLFTLPTVICNYRAMYSTVTIALLLVWRCLYKIDDLVAGRPRRKIYKFILVC